MPQKRAKSPTILTAVIAALAWGIYQYGTWAKTKKLENYLKVEKEKVAGSLENKGQKSLLHLMANVGLTEDEILHSSFRSPYINRLTKGGDDTPLATALLFEYDPSGKSN